MEARDLNDALKTPRVGKAVWVRGNRKTPGSLQLTLHHIVFTGSNGEDLRVLYTSIDVVEKRVLHDLPTVVLRCKDFRVVILQIPNDAECANVNSSLHRLSFPESADVLYPFTFKADPPETSGWSLFSLEAEFGRMGVPSSAWRLSHANDQYKLIETGPSLIFVPACVDDAVLADASLAREGRYVPTLCYLNARNQGSLVLCGQHVFQQYPKRRPADEAVLHALLVATPSGKGYILDSRSQSALASVKKKGMDLETEENYPGFKKYALGIEGRMAVRDSLIKVVDVAHNDHKMSTNTWLSKLDSSGWLNHVHAVLLSACVAAKLIEGEGACVVLHSPEPTDTVLPVATVAQVLLDPYYRTAKGFLALIEKDWLRFGHRFSDRHAHFGASGTKFRNSGAMFTLFLDCVWQVLRQYPCSFEFGEPFLFALFDNSYASNYGTFLFNCERERKASNVDRRTESLWSHLTNPHVIAPMLNPLYAYNPRMLQPSCVRQAVFFWSALYDRYEFDWDSHHRARGSLRAFKARSDDLRRKVEGARRVLKTRSAPLALAAWEAQMADESESPTPPEDGDERVSVYALARELDDNAEDAKGEGSADGGEARVARPGSALSAASGTWTEASEPLPEDDASCDELDESRAAGAGGGLSRSESAGSLGSLGSIGRSSSGDPLAELGGAPSAVGLSPGPRRA